jgi:hypothetical protein
LYRPVHTGRSPKRTRRLFAMRRTFKAKQGPANESIIDISGCEDALTPRATDAQTLRNKQFSVCERFVLFRRMSWA